MFHKRLSFCHLTILYKTSTYDKVYGAFLLCSLAKGRQGMGLVWQPVPLSKWSVWGLEIPYMKQYWLFPRSDWGSGLSSSNTSRWFRGCQAFVLRTVSCALKYLCELSSVRARRMFVRNHLKHNYPVVHPSKVYHMLGEQTDLKSWIA